MKALRPLTASLMLLTSCLLISNTTLAKTTLKLSHNQDKSHAVHKALSYLADKTKEYSNGELVIRIYPNATLGNERESLELMNSGALQMVKVNAASLESFAPDYSLFSLPFLFRDRDHYYRVLQSDLGKKILKSSESKGFVGITYYDGGARSFYSNKPITKPEDLAGMKIRVQQSPSAIAMMKALGGIPVAMSYGDVYTSLQTGIIDGTENNETALTTGKHGEICKVYSTDQHAMIPDVMVMSEKVWKNISPEDQQIILEAARESTEQHKIAWDAAIDQAIEEAKTTMGVEFVNDVDKEAFREATSAMISDYCEQYPGVKKLLDIIDSVE